MRKYMHVMILFISIQSFCKDNTKDAETTWKEALGYLATVVASAGMGAACGAYDAHYLGAQKDSLFTGINAISRSKESFNKNVADLCFKNLLPFLGVLGVTGAMWGSAFNARYSLAHGVCEDSKKNWVRRSLFFVTAWASSTAYIALYLLVRSKKPVALNIDNFKQWK